MDTSLKGLFGGGEDASAKAHDFVQRYQSGDPTQGYSDEEAKAAFSHAVKNASPQQLQKATAQAVSQLTPEQRSDFAKMLEQRKAQGRASGHMPGTATAGASTAGSGGPVIQHSSDAGAGGAAGSGGGLDDVLGGILGGAGGGGLGDILGGILGGSGGSGGSGGGGLGDILGGLMGGHSSDTGAVQQGQAQQDQQGGDVTGMIGDLMSSPVGKAVIAGIGAFAMKEMLDKK